MVLEDVLTAILLGAVEGLTEFLPVSSTGHLILLVDLLGFRGPPGRVFEIVIQLGAILAVCWIYRRKIVETAAGLRSDTAAQRFALAILLAFLPAMLLGALFHSGVKAYLFNPWTVSVALIAGGVAILAIERVIKTPSIADVAKIPPRRALAIGLYQAAALFPGVSRSGATIMGGLLLGLDRRTATEFSFFLAIPTMLAATSFDLYKNWDALTADGLLLIGAGFVSAFVAALTTVRLAIGFVSRHGFAPFAWYRIVVGCGMLLLMTSAS
ncbi:MAG: undecaprenyl-diphosphate phosphatase [Aestuariivirga sp.]